LGWFISVEDLRISLNVKRLGEGGTQTFDTHILPEISAEINGSALN
jgi:hypothetical protein